MKKNYKSFYGLLILIISFLAGSSYASNYMKIDKIKALIVGNTTHVKHLGKGFEFKVYFDKDGVTAYRTKGSDVVKTTYKFDGNQHCIFWKGKDRCADILDNGDGTYFRVKGGKNKLKWLKIVSGKDL